MKHWCFYMPMGEIEQKGEIRCSEEKKDEDGMIGSIRFLIGLETWNE